MTFDEEKEKLRLSKERKSKLYEDRHHNEIEEEREKRES